MSSGSKFEKERDYQARYSVGHSAGTSSVHLLRLSGAGGDESATTFEPPSVKKDGISSNTIPVGGRDRLAAQDFDFRFNGDSRLGTDYQGSFDDCIHLENYHKRTSSAAEDEVVRLAEDTSRYGGWPGSLYNEPEFVAIDPQIILSTTNVFESLSIAKVQHFIAAWSERYRPS